MYSHQILPTVYPKYLTYEAFVDWIWTRIAQVFKAIQIYVTQKKHFCDFVNSSVWEKIGTLSDYDVFVVVDQSPGSAISLPDIVRFIWINL